MGNLFADIVIFVVDDAIQSALIEQPLALFLAAGDTNDSAALEFGNLRDN